MAKINDILKFGWRIFTDSSQTPSVPPSEYKSDGTWTGGTELYNGEIALNLAQKKMYFRANNEIVEVGGGGTGTGISTQLYSIPSSGWTLSGNYYVHSATIIGITATNYVGVSPQENFTNFYNYGYAHILAGNQGVDSLIFSATVKPADTIYINIATS